jgi:hypothetical protein
MAVMSLVRPARPSVRRKKAAANGRISLEAAVQVEPPFRFFRPPANPAPEATSPVISYDRLLPEPEKTQAPAAHPLRSPSGFVVSLMTFCVMLTNLNSTWEMHA